MHLTKEDLQVASKVKRLNLVNSITGIKPGNLIGTIDNEGITNLAVFSSVVHLGSNPALIGFILRPNQEIKRNTYDNLLENKVYTINHISIHKTQNAHYTSVKFPKEISEFEKCGFEEEYINGFDAPFVKESSIKMGLTYLESIPIKANNTILVVGEIQHLIAPDHCISEEGYINLEKGKSAGISGLNSYYSFNKLEDYPYAREEELPKF